MYRVMPVSVTGCRSSDQRAAVLCGKAGTLAKQCPLCSQNVRPAIG